jgi:hypothetical protein
MRRGCLEEWALGHEIRIAKKQSRKFDGCAVKDMCLTLGDLSDAERLRLSKDY